jgi:hypothetical protein
VLFFWALELGLVRAFSVRRSLVTVYYFFMIGTSERICQERKKKENCDRYHIFFFSGTRHLVPVVMLACGISNAFASVAFCFRLRYIKALASEESCRIFFFRNSFFILICGQCIANKHICNICE